VYKSCKYSQIICRGEWGACGGRVEMVQKIGT